MRPIFTLLRSKPAVLTLGFVLGAAGFSLARTTAHSLADNPAATLKLAPASEGPSRTGYAPLIKEVLPSVVNISSSKVVHNRMSSDDQFPMDPFFRQFFGNDFNFQFNVPRNLREKALGSGVIASPEGYILTNNHVVDGATDIQITLSDKRQFKAHVVGTDSKTDIAVLKIDASDLKPITIGDSSKVQVGDISLAIGDPFGVGQTVTSGIISATGRTNLGIEDYEDFLQTDAPINPGNSGGALINDRGELVGINTAIISHGSGGSEGIGFAVPSNLARQVMDEILKNGHVTRAYLGIYPQDVTPAMAKAFGEKEMQGVVVGDVSPDSPAQAAGIERGDILLDVNGKPVTDSNQLRMSISMMHPGTSVDLKMLRNGNPRNVTVKLAEMPSQSAKNNSNDEGTTTKALEGVEVATLNADMAQQLDLPPNTKGVVVTGIDPSSKMADSGLQKGDVIQQVNHQPVTNVSEFERAVRNSGSNPLLLVNRGGTTLFIAS
ncbi:MAG TPA: DegQ family serine endoprotease [Candidatus Methylomirabilis sp.]|nr:DegQ family serine endoprotease [Candidatus Methylomirabilis sp.]